ncbi:MAG: type VI secretion system-associated FHA domain protein [Methylococcales bacterium]
MSLLLKVLSFKGQPLPEAMQLVIDRHGATIGRSDLNTLVLPDPEKFISRHHATITYEQGHYHLSDCSLSGIFIDTQKIPIRNESRLLSDGMLLRIGEYKISVIISDPSETQPNTSSYADEFSNNDSPLPNVTRTSKTKSNKAATKSDIEHIEEITTLNYQKSHRIEVDENIDSASPFCTELLEAFLQGVGLYRDDIKIHHPAETMEKIGQMFREMVKGTIAVLRSRAEFKSFFRVTMTVMKPSHNNPLKAIVSTDDVLRQLLQDEAVDFIDSVDAIEQGFSDVMDLSLINI